VAKRLDHFVVADLDGGIPEGVGDGFDVVLAADVLEHVREPERILRDARARLRPGGCLITSVPNFGHWYPRTRVALGRFDYDRRGILDRDHVRFFTRRSFERLVALEGFHSRRRETLGLPLEVLGRGLRERRAPGETPVRFLQRVDGVGVTLRPTLFAYQFLYELEPVRALD
jgi:SAM-dependent methyltransferase